MEHAWEDEKYVQNFGRKMGGGRDDAKDLDVDGEIILMWILWCVRVYVGLKWLRKGSSTN